MSESRLVANLVRLGHCRVLGEYEQAADIGLPLHGFDANVEVDHLDLITTAMAQRDLLGDAHIAGPEGTLNELEELVAFDPR